MELTRTRKAREAQFAHCPKCDAWYDSCAPVPWSLAQTVHMHRRGCGGACVLYVLSA